MKNLYRKNNGKYDFSKMTLICECGHPLSVHAGQNDTDKRPCFNSDKGIEGATGHQCLCLNFKTKKS